jgi:anaerobic selenocysteine-containing dehydrogenase
MYASSVPATIFQGGALDHGPYPVHCSRATAIIVAISGNLEMKGGNVYGRVLAQDELRVPGRVNEKTNVGYEYPIYDKFTWQGTAMTIPHAILHEDPYPIKSLIVDSSNPLVTWPNTDRVKKAFQKLDTLVVIDIFLTATAKAADYVLPSATCFEGIDLNDSGYFGALYLEMRNKVLDPPPDCLASWEIYKELGMEMGYGEFFPWESEEEVLKTLLKPTDVDLESLKRNPGGVQYGDVEEKTYLQKGFNTPSGKVEIFSETLKQAGYDPLPVYREPSESPVSTPELAEKYPFILTTKGREKIYTHSQQRNIARLRKIVPEAYAEINPKDAMQAGVNDGESVRVENPRGAIKVKASLTDDIMPGVVRIIHGWDGTSNVNLLTQSVFDPISGFPELTALLCNITKA